MSNYNKSTPFLKGSVKSRIHDGSSDSTSEEEELYANGRNCNNDPKNLKFENPGAVKRLRPVSPSVSESTGSEVSFCMSTFESRRRKNAPLRIAIEGNIAAGKSTFIQILSDLQKSDPTSSLNWYIQPEPLEKWTDNSSKGSNLLQAFYTDPKRWAYTFEAYTFITRMKQALDADRQVKHDLNEKEQESDKENQIECDNQISKLDYQIESGHSAITFFERSVYSSRLVFAENCYESGCLSPTEWALYCDWSNYLISTVKSLKLDGIIYLKCKPKTCIDRMKKRNRSEENKVPAEYLEALHQKYETWLNGWMKDSQLSRDSNHSEGTHASECYVSSEHNLVKRALQDVNVLVVDCSEDFEHNKVNRDKMLKEVGEYLKKLEFYDEDESTFEEKISSDVVENDNVGERLVC